MMEPGSPLTDVAGIGEKTAKLYEKLNIYNVGDLLHWYPYRYDDLRFPSTVEEAVPGENTLISARVVKAPRWISRRGRFSMFSFDVADDTGVMHINMFNVSFMFRKYGLGRDFCFYGRPKVYNGVLQMDNPETFDADLKPALKPCYRLTAGISQRGISKAIDHALKNTTVRDMFSAEFLMENGLLDEKASLELIHHPSSDDDIKRARGSIAFTSFIVYLREAELLDVRTGRTEPLAVSRADVDDFCGALGFSCTMDQRKAMDDVLTDLTGSRPMNRLVQGDVGSGKTAVAFCAAYLVVKGGGSAVMMAPTGLLAVQHYEKAREIFGDSVGLLTGSSTAKERRLLFEDIALGRVRFLIGTHALLYSDLPFDDLRLIITDEQHRFGVRQRAALPGGEKGIHTLIMSATPIPRTLTLILFNKTDISSIKELPPGRQETETFVIGRNKRQSMYEWLKKLTDGGEQAYVVCPLIEESEGVGAASVAAVFGELRGLFKESDIACLHGKMSQREKDGIMESFRMGEIRVLISTTVVEVGVDVPNATVMIVEDADHFGLAQLHQLRGRVGRGSKKSYCYLVSDGSGAERLSVLKESNDGFYIAEKDLELRGGGELLGERQHGTDSFLWDMIGNADALMKCRDMLPVMRERFPADYARVDAVARKKAETLEERIVLN